MTRSIFLVSSLTISSLTLSASFVGCASGVFYTSENRVDVDAAVAVVDAALDAGAPDVRDAIRDAGAPDARDVTPDAGAPDAGAPDAGAPDAGAPDTGALDAGADAPREEPLDLTTVRWIHPDISDWPVTTELRAVHNGPLLCLEYDKRDVWPYQDVGHTHANGNAWVFAEVDGEWVGATWEWLREGPNQHCNLRRNLEGGHAKAPPLSGDWRPSSGDVLYFMVSGLIRGPQRNVSERSHLVETVWP